MKTMTAVFLTASAALIFAACGAPPANNTPANTNANTAKPVAAAPTVDALMALEKQAHEAYSKANSAFFEGFLSDKFTMQGMKGEHVSKADTVKMISTVKCDIKSMDLTEPQMARIDNDTYVVSSKVTWDGTCTENGKAHKVPSPVRSASVYVRNGDKWMGAWHGETKILGDTDAPPPPVKKDAPKAETKKDEPKAEAKKPEAKPAKAADASGAVDSSAAADSKTLADKAKSTTAAKTTDATANAPTAAKPTADPNTDALMKIHTAGWEGWKARDAKVLGDLTSSNLSFVEADGMWYGDKAATIKAWTEPKCDIKSVSLSDGFAQALSPTVEVLYSKGTATGTCEGPDGKPVKLTPLWGSAVYVKEGADWKLAFLFESPA